MSETGPDFTDELPPIVIPTIGRIVLYTLTNGPHSGEDRPAMVTKVLEHGQLHLNVFTLGVDDGATYSKSPTVTVAEPSRHRDLGKWHWPARV
jgi:hypothetical protein